MDNAKNFRALIESDGNEDLAARAMESAAIAIHRADAMGITLDVNAAFELPWVRILALTGSEIGDLEAELEATPQGQKIVEDRELMAAIHDFNSDVARRAAAEQAIADEMAALHPAERMRRAREMGQTFTPPEAHQRKMSAAEKAIELQKLEAMPSAMRIQRARELGL
jgi:hypothetical protein